MCFAWQAQGFRHVAKYVAGAGVREGCKNVGRRGGFEEGLKRCVSRGRRKDFALCDVDVPRGSMSAIFTDMPMLVLRADIDMYVLRTDIHEISRNLTNSTLMGR